MSISFSSFIIAEKTPKIDSGETGLNQRRANKQQPGRDVKIPQQQLSRAKFREPPAGWKRGLEPLKAFCRFSVIKHQAFFIGYQ